MVEFTKRAWNYFFQHQFMRYCFAGGSGAAVDFSIFYLLTRSAGWHFVQANMVSFFASAIVNYSINRAWTFKGTQGHIGKQFAVFCLVAVFGIVINTGILYLLVTYAHLYDMLAKVFAIAVVIAWNYLWNKHVTFKRV